MANEVFGLFMQNMNTIIIVGVIVGIAIGGILIRRRWVRIVLWVLSLPSFGIGLLALVQGGIAEPFTQTLISGVIHRYVEGDMKIKTG